MSRDEIKYLHALNLTGKIGPQKFKRLYSYFNTFEAAFKASQKELGKAGLEEKTVWEILKLRKGINPDQEMKKVEKSKIKMLRLFDDEYPQLLKEIYDPPYLLYVKGELDKESHYLAVVGTRKATDYGQEVTFDLVSELAQSGLTIVSGLAQGIDSFAHEAALLVKGETIAVFACGLNKVYPSSNERLAEKILASGNALISEYPPSTPPLIHQFPLRNRIISGLSLGTLIIEAGEKSGALITAFSALEQNREVFAVPGNIYNPSSMGTNFLLKRGAHLVTRPEDILEIFKFKQVKPLPLKNKKKPETAEEKTIITCLKKQSLSPNQLVKETLLRASEVNAGLTTLELKGIIKNLGGIYVLKP